MCLCANLNKARVAHTAVCLFVRVFGWSCRAPRVINLNRTVLADDHPHIYPKTHRVISCKSVSLNHFIYTHKVFVVWRRRCAYFIRRGYFCQGVCRISALVYILKNHYIEFIFYLQPFLIIIASAHRPSASRIAYYFQTHIAILFSIPWNPFAPHHLECTRTHTHQ